ncbi:MAG: carboxypeptidase-like regulatory domain-containing protein [Chitinophagaceae bacterium]
MKNVKLKIAALTLATASIFAFNSGTTMQAVSIKGTVSPAEGASKVWALSSTDTLKADIDKGTFEIPNVKPGIYQVIIEAKSPYKNTAKDGVTVEQGKGTDVGEIKLDK